MRTEILKNGRPVADFGCSYLEYLELIDHCDKPVRSFVRQRGGAKYRGLSWELSLTQWWSIWQESGHWEQRGRGAHAYCMCRKGDVGPYAVGNVFIAEFRQNASIHTRKKSLLPMGVSVHRRRFLARRRINRKIVTIGSFETAELAGAAYLASVQSEAAAMADPPVAAAINISWCAL